MLLEAVVRRYSVNNVSWKILQNSQEETYTRVSFLIRASNFSKRGSGTVVFLWILRNTFFIEHLWWLLLSYYSHMKKPLVWRVWLEHFCLINLIVTIHLSFVLSLTYLKESLDKHEIDLLILAIEKPNYFENYTL